MKAFVVFLLLTIMTAVVIALTGCGGGGSENVLSPPANIMDAKAWQLGPLVDNPVAEYGTQGTPDAHPEGWSINFPAAPGSVRYVTVPSGSLTGKTSMTIKGRWEMADGARLVPRRFPNAPPLMTLYFQRSGDDWSAQGDKEAYRQYASFGTVQDMKAGEFTMTARFDQNWTAILSSSRENNLAGFNAALANAARIGFVMGGGDGLGHGVYAIGDVRLVVTSFKIE